MKLYLFCNLVVLTLITAQAADPKRPAPPKNLRIVGPHSETQVATNTPAPKNIAVPSPKDENKVPTPEETKAKIQEIIEQSHEQVMWSRYEIKNGHEIAITVFSANKDPSGKIDSRIMDTANAQLEQILTASTNKSCRYFLMKPPKKRVAQRFGLTLG